MKILNVIASAAIGGLMVFGVGSAHAQEPGFWQKIQSRGSLRCGAAVAPPHVMRDPASGQFSGVFIDLCKEIADVVGVKAEVIDTSWDNIVAGLQADRWDLSLALNRTSKRALAIAFTDSAWDYQVSIVHNKANPKIDASWKSLADFDKAGVTIAIMSGTAQEQILSTQIKNATLLRLPDSDATRLALMSRRADVLVDDADSNLLFTTKNGEDWVTVLPEPAIAKQGVGIGLPRNVTGADLAVINILFAEKIAKGEMKASVDKYVKQLLDQE
ncbi:substrate-binding periplasmic protein [Sinorhizobium fredii]|uniref:Amino acid ABC transporter substrate-binding protein n=1 Tax=Rhizobium fredii TaxID=380 RepID=A0A2L0HAF7_RHIFR|nr:transporter substrate-binding domain-containing protein [Sinorhizobium fredii]AUX78463.1 amino acid ABC transporter substrate-binding protein [Sinorhizobium fredii]